MKRFSVSASDKMVRENIGGFFMILFAVLQCPVSEGSIPSYITPCKKSDPNITECFTENANKALPYVFKGDESIGLPTLDPYFAKEYPVKLSTLNLLLTNGLLTSPTVPLVKKLKVDLDNRHWQIVLFIETGISIWDYEMTGQLLIMPVEGKGKCNITLKNALYTFDYYYDLIEKDGKKYMTTNRTELDFELGRMHVHFGNLFSALLGDQINDFLDESWRELFNLMKPFLANFQEGVTKQVLETYFKAISYDEIFPD